MAGAAILSTGDLLRSVVAVVLITAWTVDDVNWPWGWLRSFPVTLCASLVLLHYLIWVRPRAALARALRRDEEAGIPVHVAISGCDSGFGLLLCQDLVARTERTIVFAGCLTSECLSRLRDFPAANDESGRLIPVQLDVTDEASCAAFAARVREEQLRRPGPPGAFILVNNAGVSDGALLDWTPIDVLRRVMEVNFLGTAALTKACLPLVKAAGKRGRVINLASFLGRMGLGGTAAYCCSKHAVTAFSDVVRRELAPWGCTVVNVEPGSFKTGIVGQSFDNIRRLWQSAPAAIREEYGEAYFKEMTETSERAVDQIAGAPSRVAAVLADAVLAPPEHPPSKRLCVGIESQLIFRVLGWCSLDMQDWVLAKLQPRIVPASLSSASLVARPPPCATLAGLGLRPSHASFGPRRAGWTLV